MSKHTQLELCDYPKNTLRKSHMITSQCSTSIVQASYSLGLQLQHLVSKFYQFLQGMNDSTPWPRHHRTNLWNFFSSQQNSSSAMTKSSEQLWPSPFIDYSVIPSIGHPWRSQQSLIINLPTFPALKMLAIKCNLVIFLAYFVNFPCLNVSFMFFFSTLFSPFLSNQFHCFKIISQLFFQ